MFEYSYSVVLTVFSLILYKSNKQQTITVLPITFIFSYHLLAVIFCTSKVYDNSLYFYHNFIVFNVTSFIKALQKSTQFHKVIAVFIDGPLFLRTPFTKISFQPLANQNY